jgi:hypothetical protein
MKYSKGVMWLDDCRIPFVDEGDRGSIDRSDRNVMMGWKTDSYVNGIGNNTLPPEQAEGSPLGRFTPNLLVCDDMLNDGSIGGNNSNKFYEPQYEDTSNIYGKYKQLQVTQYKDKGSSSRYYDLDKWFDKIIDEIQ